MSFRFTLFAVFSVLVHAGLLLWSQEREVRLGLGGEARALRVSVAAQPATTSPPARSANAVADGSTGLHATRPVANPAASAVTTAPVNTHRPAHPVRPPDVQRILTASATSTKRTLPPTQAEHHKEIEPARHTEATQQAVNSAPSTAAQRAPDVSRRISVALRNRLSRYFEYPWLARQRGWEGRVLLSLTVMGNGDLGNWKVVGTSGYRTLDQSALKAARRIDSLPQARAWLNGRSLEVQVPVQYRLLDS